MKRIELTFLALFTTAWVFGQDAPSDLQAHSNAGQQMKTAHSTLTGIANGMEIGGIAHHQGSAEAVLKETRSSPIRRPEEKIPEEASKDEWMQNDPVDGKQPKEVKKVAKARNQAKPEKLDRRSARGHGDKRPGAHRPNRAGRPGGAGRPNHRNR